MNSRSARCGLLLVFLVCALVLLAQTPADPLLSGFRNPPDSAKPRVWWHWMNGNITKEGIKADLEWMKRTGIGGFQNFDASLDTPQVVEKRLVYMTPEWKGAFRYTATLADQLGLEMAIAGSPGWSESGGPWVPPAQAMKKLVWRETRMEGGHPFSGVLPKPPSTTGPFQAIPRGGPPVMYQGVPAEYYADTAVIAYRVPAGEISFADLNPRVTSSGGHFDVAGLSGEDLSKPSPLPAAMANNRSWIQFDFGKPQSIRGITIATGGGRGSPQLESSDEGSQFKNVVTIPAGGAAEHTLTFPPVAARYFRATFLIAVGASAIGRGSPGDIQISRLVLHPSPRVNRFEEKAAFATLPDLYAWPTPAATAEESIKKTEVIDLTSKMRADGTLEWTPPEGRWVVLRFGYSLTGARNSPASPEATGLEVDKLNSRFVKAYEDRYLGMYKDILGDLMGRRGLQYVITDSWEAGVQNWTDEMIAEFTKRRGYDPRPWLPVLTGRVEESAEASDRFLWDFRKTIGELTTENHYEQIGASLKERGMGRYSESHESGRAFIGDGMEVKRNATVPMSAMWVMRPGFYPDQHGYNNDVRESASVAHIYGQNLVAAESLTARGDSAWTWSPETLKPVADRELAMGLNRFVIHTSVHQPVDDKAPGLGLGPYGQWFTRHETWAEFAKPWITYLTRSSYMLQQGRFVADVLYYYGEDSNITAQFSARSPEIPAGYNFDYVNADALVHKMTALSGRITTSTGMNYRVLFLDPRAVHMSLPVLRKIRDLVNGGAIVVGAKPSDDPSLSDNQSEFRTIADQLWGSGKVKDQPLTAALSEVQPDLQYTKPQPDTNLLFVHRRLTDGDVYWVNNRSNRMEALDATFRVSGKAPELWHAETGLTEPASYTISGGRTTVPLRLDPYDAVFVVFRKPAAQQTRTIPVPVETRLATVDGAWDISFQVGRGAPEKVTIERLASWSESPDRGVKYFSGTGTYTKTIQAAPEWFQPGAKLCLDLGDVKNIAQVSVNGKDLGIIWKPPFRVDVTGTLKPGANTLEVKVTNLWVNRLIGDQQPGETRKYTYTTQVFYRAEAPLLPSGLIGPAALLRTK